MKKIILKVILGTIILEAILICIFILLGSFKEVGWKSILSVIIILECSIPCLFYAKIYDNPKYKNIALLGATISGINAVISILSLWIDLDSNKIIDKIERLLHSFMWLFVFIAQLLSYNLNEKLFNIFKKISIYTLIVLNIFISVIIWTGQFPKDFTARLFFMIIIIAVASYIATLIVVRMYKKSINANNNREIQNMNENINNNNINN